MRLSEAPAKVQEVIGARARAATNALVAVTARAIARDISDMFGVCLPDSVTADDLQLWAVARIRGELDRSVADLIEAVHERRGFTTERIAEDLGFTKGAHLRRKFTPLR